MHSLILVLPIGFEVSILEDIGRTTMTWGEFSTIIGYEIIQNTELVKSKIMAKPSSKINILNSLSASETKEYGMFSSIFN